MRKFTLLLIALTLVLWTSSGMAQTQRGNRKANENRAVPAPKKAIDNIDGIPGTQNYNPTVSVKSVLDDPSTMVTTYDLQTNSTCQNRLYRYPDGTFGATCTWSASTSGSTFADRGTGYNYFNGNSWGAAPTARVETSVRTGWPSYAPLGSGEIIIAHNVTAGNSLIMSTRPAKGTGAWTTTQPAGLLPPAGAAVMSWPRMVTNGANHMNIHIIALTEPVANGGTLYNGMDGALLYNRSTDGGATWGTWQQLPGMTSSQYIGIGADAYGWAEPHGDTLCFLVGDSWNDEFIMKSTNNGNSWTKTIIWQCPYDLWPGTTQTDTFYGSDGANAVALDKNGIAHVAFGRMRNIGDNAGAKSYFPFTDGMIYWDETMATLPQSLDETTLRTMGVWLASVKDTMVWYQAATQLAYYYRSMTSYPTMVTDNAGNIFVFYSSLTTLLDPNSYMLRHIFARTSIGTNGASWSDSITEITSNFFQYHWEECAYPSAAANSTDSLFILFQGDLEAGVYLNGINPGVQGQIEITNNDMIFLKESKGDLGVLIGINEKKSNPSLKVYQNIPNPFVNQTNINVTTVKAGNLSVEVYSLVGQKVAEIDKGYVSPGNYTFTLNASQFTRGVYFYTVRNNNESSTHKMIVE